jgi:ADP-heptose:LPS heptosyltransferase
MEKIKSKFVKYSHDTNLINNLAKVTHCDFFIGSDSAFKTMSSMLKIPTIVIYPNIKMSSFGYRMFFKPYLSSKTLSICHFKNNTRKEIIKTLTHIKKIMLLFFGLHLQHDRT